ncbi:MAG: hypothetical protein IPF72_17175 [Chitinophagaceae bacterium]|nr:hypothetical protein [Chitinophagaceae bacterium]
MTKIDSIKDTLKNNSAYRDNFIQALVEFEKRSGHPQVNVRDTVSGPLADELFMGEAFSKTLQNGLHINFVYNSKLQGSFYYAALQCQTMYGSHKQQNYCSIFSTNAQNVIIAGAYFGDQAIPVANNIKSTGVCHTFEPNKNNSDLIIENAGLNNLNNILINNLALWNKSNEKLILVKTHWQVL